jgi:hypothetical protein
MHRAARYTLHDLKLLRMRCSMEARGSAQNESRLVDKF